MAHYLVRAQIRTDRLEQLAQQLESNAFFDLEPFGPTLSDSLAGARVAEPGVAVWEEEDYCSPPLAQERAAVLDRYFDGIEVEPVSEGEGWRRVEELPRLFPDLDVEDHPEAAP